MSGGWESPGGPPQPGPPQPGPPQWGEPQWGQPQPQQESNGKAVTAMVLGICGLLVCPVILSIVALILGYQAKGEIDRSGGRQSGRGMAVAGIVLGWIGVALGVLGIIFIVVAILVGASFEDDLDLDTSTTGEDPFNAITFAADALTALGGLL